MLRAEEEVNEGQSTTGNWVSD